MAISPQSHARDTQSTMDDGLSPRVHCDGEFLSGTDKHARGWAELGDAWELTCVTWAVLIGDEG